MDNEVINLVNEAYAKRRAAEADAVLESLRQKAAEKRQKREMRIHYGIIAGIITGEFAFTIWHAAGLVSGWIAVPAVLGCAWAALYLLRKWG